MTVTIVAARRSPIGTAGHGLAALTAADLAAALLPPVIADAGLTADDVSEVVLGNCTGPGGDLARYAALQAGLGVGVPGLTVDRQCGSGLAALVVGAAWSEDRSCGDRGWGGVGVHVDPGRAGCVRPARVRGDPEMGEVADLVAAIAGIGRERQDDYALRSTGARSRPPRAGCSTPSSWPVGGLTTDERPRPGMTRERLARMRPIFSARGPPRPAAGAGSTTARRRWL